MDCLVCDTSLPWAYHARCREATALLLEARAAWVAINPLHADPTMFLMHAGHQLARHWSRR